MTGLLVKDSILTLPSEGLLNEGADLLGGDSVKIRPFVASDQKILAGQRGDSYKIYRNLLSRVVLEPKALAYDDLLLSDVNSILFAVRTLSYGPGYRLQFKCSFCGVQQQMSLNLTELEVRYASELDESPQGVSEVVLGEHAVAFHLPRLRDEKEANIATSRAKRRADASTFSTFDVEKAFVRLALLIDSIDGSAVNFTKALEFVNSLDMCQFDDLGMAISDADTGIINQIDLECTSCGWLEEGSLAVDAEFFRPKRRRS